MIKTFKSKETNKIFKGEFSKKLPSDIQKIALRKLVMIHAAAKVSDLKVPPGNKLEPLKGNRLGQYSIRINQQWRVCFEFKSENAYNVEIVDYH